MNAGKVREYHVNYATLKARGVVEKKYIQTIHKMPVKISGYELSEAEKEKKELLRISKGENKKAESERESEERFLSSIIRSKSNVLQLIANNPWEYFVTFTFKREGLNFDIFNLSEANKKVFQFFNNYAKRSGADTNFMYLLIPELQPKSGAVHYHGVMSGINPKDLFINKNGYWDFRPYAERFGYVSFGKKKRKAKGIDNQCGMGKIKDLNKAASYITKYINKDMFNTLHVKPGQHMYYASKGLNKDDVIARGRMADGVKIEELTQKSDFVSENEFCVKMYTDNRDLYDGLITPFVNYDINDMRVHPTFKQIEAQKFMRKYGWIASRVRADLTLRDCEERNERYWDFKRFLLDNGYYGYDSERYKHIWRELIGVRFSYALADDMSTAVVEGVTLEELPGDLWKWSRLTGEQTSINCG